MLLTETTMNISSKIGIDILDSGMLTRIFNDPVIIRLGHCPNDASAFAMRRAFMLHTVDADPVCIAIDRPIYELLAKTEGDNIVFVGTITDTMIQLDEAGYEADLGELSNSIC